MLAWDHLRFALALARHGTLARTGAALGVEVADASARLQALESAAGAALFLRTRAGFQPTDAGRRVLRAGERMAEEMTRLGRALPPTTARLRVRLSIEPELATLWLRAGDPSLRAALGGVELEMVGPSAAELTVGWSRPARTGWTARSLGALGVGLYDSAASIAERGRPSRDLAALADARWVLGSGALARSAGGRWATRLAQVSGMVALRTDDPRILQAAVAAGLGVGVLLQGSEDADPRLARLFALPDLRPRQVWLGRPGATRGSRPLATAAKLLDATLGAVIRGWDQRG